MYYSQYFAQTASGYGCSAYGDTQSYNSCEPTTPAAQTSNLQDTGFSAYIPVVISVVIIIIAVGLLVKRKPKK